MAQGQRERRDSWWSCNLPNQASAAPSRKFMIYYDLSVIKSSQFKHWGDFLIIQFQAQEDAKIQFSSRTLFFCEHAHRETSLRRLFNFYGGVLPSRSQLPLWRRDPEITVVDQETLPSSCWPPRDHLTKLKGIHHPVSGEDSASPWAGFITFDSGEIVWAPR